MTYSTCYITALAEGRRLLLITSSTIHGKGYLDHGEREIAGLLAGISRVQFVPHALLDRSSYTAKAEDPVSIGAASVSESPR